MYHIKIVLNSNLNNSSFDFQILNIIRLILHMYLGCVFTPITITIIAGDSPQLHWLRRDLFGSLEGLVDLRLVLVVPVDQGPFVGCHLGSIGCFH